MPSRKQPLRCEDVAIWVRSNLSTENTLLRNISFSVQCGDILALVGESGSGKTTLLRAITRLFSHENNLQVSGRIMLDGTDMVSANPKEIRQLRKGIRYIFQEPGTAFSPVSRIGSQIHTLIGRNPKNDERFLGYLSELGLSEFNNFLEVYPHQLSTGMLQRISIALALLDEPVLILADEPTSALDAIHRCRAFDLLVRECRTRNIALLFSTHDIKIARPYATSIVVLLKGQIVEQSSTEDFFRAPSHPYSQALLGKVLLPGNAEPCDWTIPNEHPITQE